MEGKALYQRGFPHSINFMLRTYGGWRKAMSKFRQWVGICSGGRIVFGEGQGVGPVPKSAKAGDVICVLHGSKVQIVLRSLDRCYTVIGQCYWRGWMYGEKVDWAEEEGMCISLCELPNWTGRTKISFIFRSRLFTFSSFRDLGFCRFNLWILIGVEEYLSRRTYSGICDCTNTQQPRTGNAIKCDIRSG